MTTSKAPKKQAAGKSKQPRASKKPSTVLQRPYAHYSTAGDVTVRAALHRIFEDGYYTVTEEDDREIEYEGFDEEEYIESYEAALTFPFNDEPTAGEVAKAEADLRAAYRYVYEVRPAVRNAIFDEIGRIRQAKADEGLLLVITEDAPGRPVLDAKVSKLSMAMWTRKHLHTEIVEWSQSLDILELRSSPDLRSETKQTATVDWSDVKLTFRKNDFLAYSLKGERPATVSLVSGPLWDKGKNCLNQRGLILKGLSRGKQYPPKGVANQGRHRTAMSRLSAALTSIVPAIGKPFHEPNEEEGWKPRFTIENSEVKADQALKDRAKHDEYDDEIHGPRDYEAEDDPAAAFLKKHDK